MKTLTRLRIAVPEEKFELLQGYLAYSVPYGWQEELFGSESACIVHSVHPGFCKELGESLCSLLPEAKISSEEVEELDWLEAWKVFFTPVEAGKDFIVLAPWMNEEKQSTKRIPLIIEPKMAFGTGHHPSTALCLSLISLAHERGLLRRGMRFFDLGTGSGILAIAAAKFGLEGRGVDIDMASVENALENREINGVEADKVEFFLGGVDLAEGSYDLICANILAEPLCFMAPDIVKALKARTADSELESNSSGETAPSQGGILILSGILRKQAEQVEEAYKKLGLPKAEHFTSGEWSALLFTL